MQKIISGYGCHHRICEILCQLHVEKYLLVCDSSYPYLSISTFDSLPIPHVMFDGFTPNPLYEDVCKGVELYNHEGCDAIIAVGGGSAIDVAKCIKLFCGMGPEVNYLTQTYVGSKILLIAIPTTAGTGSESTRFAVIYNNGEKQSIAHESIIPNYAILEPGVLRTLPVYQKKCTMLDAFCQAIESWWSINSSDESKTYSKQAVKLFMGNRAAYIADNAEEAAENMMLAANLAGRAINITQTTAAHAMSYKLTSLYGLPHGHAVAVCLPKVWAYMVCNTDQCIDPRGEDYLRSVFSDIARELGCVTIDDAIQTFRDMLAELQISNPEIKNKGDYDILGKSVNPVRLKNNPVAISESDLMKLYRNIVRCERI